MTIIQPFIIAIAGGLAAFLLLISFYPNTNPLARRIAAMENVTEKNQIEREAKFKRIFIGENTGATQVRLIEAGWYGVSPTSFALRGLAGLGFGVAIGLAFLLILPNKSLALFVGVLFAAIGWRTPKIALDRAISSRKRAIARMLPDFLDMLASTVKAGLALNAAMVQAADATAGALKMELLSTLAEVRLGRGRAEALQAMATRINEPQVTTMVTGIVQAELLGSNISTMLRELAIDSRHQRWSLAEERAAKLPIKMLLPMGLLMMPSLYVMIFGPVLANIASSFGHK